jgi:cysteinyl-tRNA synthetase
LMAHYRSDIDFSWDSLTQAKQTRQRIIDFINRVNTIKPHRKNLKLQKLIRDTYNNFKKSLFSDLDSPKAIAFMFDFIKEVNSSIDAGDPIPRRHIIKLFQRLERVLALDLPLTKTSIPTEIMLIFNNRNQARANKDFDQADKLRQELSNLGYIIQDKDGQSVIIKTK